jgi:hypothetical protein
MQKKWDGKIILKKSLKMSKKTAVEWLYNELLNSEPNILEWNKLFEQAKAMEKEQIINAWMATDNELQRIAAEQYYNETYGR